MRARSLSEDESGREPLIYPFTAPISPTHDPLEFMRGIPIEDVGAVTPHRTRFDGTVRHLDFREVGAGLPAGSLDYLPECVGVRRRIEDDGASMVSSAILPKNPLLSPS